MCLSFVGEKIVVVGGFLISGCIEIFYVDLDVCGGGYSIFLLCVMECEFV